MRSPPRLFMAALGLMDVPCAPAPADAATKVVEVSAQPIKPLTLSRVQDLELGSIVLGPGTWSNASVSISQTGTFRCTGPNLTCSGVTHPATYTVTGSNGQIVRITAPNVVITNQNNPAQTLTLVLDSPGLVVLQNSGSKGAQFSIGGSINLNSTTGGGTYTGMFDVTVDY